MNMNKIRETNKKCAEANERFGATAGGSADLKGSAEMPPLRQAAIPLGASGGQRCGQSSRTENVVQPDKVVELSTVPTMKYSACGQ
jgi:hypothetical protein